jgi:pyruvate/2-oxoglutarate dehydrogenase complex dihydrolipoamide dehydrogenase (E3) component
VPPIEGLDAIPFLTNESIMELDEVPDHLAIIGGGYIGVEFGQMFRRFGSEVTILQRGDQLLPREDTDVAEEATKILREEGISILTNAQTKRVQASDSGHIDLEVSLNGATKKLQASHLLVATGRKPNSDQLNLEATGIETDKGGHIVVNDRLETGVEGVWALGDVKGGPAFTHISYDDSRIIQRNLWGDGEGTIKGRVVSYTVFMDPQLGRVGMSERQARESGRKIKVATMPMTSVARALETDETHGMVKAVVDAETERILGFAMLGIEGGEIAGAVQLVMLADQPYTILRDTPFSHPTVLESMNNLFAKLS